MQLALECSTKMLGQVQPFADFDFLLTHLVLQDEAYAEFYKSSDKRRFLDNSVNELGTPETLENIKKAYEKVKNNSETFIVSPDFIGDFKKTLEMYVECIKLFQDTPVGLVAVLQGSTYEEAFTCLRFYLQIHNGKTLYLSVPYDICSKKTDPPELMALRRSLVVSNIPSSVQIHLLGFSDIKEFWWYKGKSNILSLDTGIPVLLGLQGKGVEEPLEAKSKPTLELMEGLPLTKENYGTVCRNIALFRTYI